MTMAAPTSKDYLIACNAAYCECNLAEATSVIPSEATLLKDVTNSLVSMGEKSWDVLTVDYIPKDGFYGVAFLTNTGNLLVTYEGTNPVPSTYGVATIAADALVVAHRTPTQLVADDDKFALGAENLAAATHGFNGDAYVTGHSLGGVEAEYATLELNSSAGHVSGVTFDGGATFGALGIPGYSHRATPAPPLIDYVDYGDPAGNYASNMPSGGGKDYFPIFSTPQDHVGTVEMVGKPSDWDIFSAKFLEFDYHYLPRYEDDLGVSITGGTTVGTPSLAADLWDYVFSLF